MVTLGTGGPPKNIPTVPPFAVSYDDVAGGELIGQGGNADVYRVPVEHHDSVIQLAVKQPRLQGTLNVSAVDRFIEEAEVWHRLDNHNHVVSVVDWGDQPLPWLAMEYMDGGTLGELIAGERLPLDQALWVGLCVCRAVRHAHRHGVAHHDIKPANILFQTIEGHWMVPKVSDWGLARLMIEETGSVNGLSPQYAAPEQFDASTFGSPDDVTDIYQLGVLVYELTTGQPPFEGAAADVMQGILTETPTPPSEIADVPEAIDDAVMPALRKEKSDRYESVIYLRDALEELLETHRQSDTENGSTIGDDPSFRPAETTDSSTPTILDSTQNGGDSTPTWQESGSGSRRATADERSDSAHKERTDAETTPSTRRSESARAVDDRTNRTGSIEGKANGTSRRSLLKAGVGVAGVAGIVGAGFTLIGGSSETGDELSTSGSGDTAGAVQSEERSDELDVIMVVGFPESGIPLFRDFYSTFASEVPNLDILVPDGLIDPNLPEEVGNDLDNVIGIRPSDGGPGSAFYGELYETTYGESPGVFTAHAYDAMAISILAATAAGENNGRMVRDRIRTVTNPGGEEFGPESLVHAVETVAAGDPIRYVGASSRIDFDANGDLITAGYDIVEFQGGDLDTVETAEFGMDPTDEDEAAVAEPPVGVDNFEARVGVLMPETGALGSVGGPIRDGALLAAEQVNDADLNVTVETRVEDTQTDVQAAISGADTLVDAGFPAVVGPAASHITLEVSEQVFIQNGVVGVSPSSTAPAITHLDDDGYVFRTCPSDALQGSALAELARGDRIEATSSGTLYLNQDYGHTLEEKFANSFEDFGGNIGERVSFEPEQSSYSSQWDSVLDS